MGNGPKGVSEMKIFRLNEYEWWAAETLEEAKQACLEETGLDESEAFEDPCELSSEELDALIFVDDEGPERRTIPFRQALDELISKGQKFPCIFATSIY